MTMNGQGQFPGMPGAPGAAPGAQGSAFVLDIPPDPTWEPFDTTDVLDNDGYYCAQITKEAVRSDSSKKPGVFLTLTIQDEDARGKILSKLMVDPRQTQKDTWFTWRNLIRSITGGLDHSRAGMQYIPGMFTNQVVYIKTGAYNDDGGNQRTGVDTFTIKAEWEAAVKAGRHRWPAKIKAGGASGALPSGLPGGFPGASFPGLPGAPTPPVPGQMPVAPQPQVTVPMQQMPQAPPQVPQMPQQQAPQGFPGFPQAAPQMPAQPAAPTQTFGFPAAPPSTSVAPQPQAPQFPFPPPAQK